MLNNNKLIPNRSSLNTAQARCTRYNIMW